MTEQEIREANFMIYRWDVNPTLPETEKLKECERCEGIGKTELGHCKPCFGTGYEYPGDDAVIKRLAEVRYCPESPCLKVQRTNGLIAWCDAGHVFQLAKDDPRYSLA